jgi:MSHA biogenesis protein MshO
MLRRSLSAHAIRHSGFTLVELIFVLVILGLVASMGSGFVVSALDTYKASSTRHQLLQRGRLVIEQMSRELRMALPNSLRTSASGNCIEFMPVVAASQARSVVPDIANNRPVASSIAVALFDLTSNGDHVVIAPLTSADVYTASNPAARTSLGSLSPGTHTSIPLGGNHRFTRNSASRRVYIGADPVRFCLVGGGLLRYSNYGFSTSALTDSNPGGDSAIMSHAVSTSSQAFTLSAGSEDRNTSAHIQLDFTRDTLTLALQHQVLVRNVP